MNKEIYKQSCEQIEYKSWNNFNALISNQNLKTKIYKTVIAPTMNVKFDLTLKEKNGWKYLEYDARGKRRKFHNGVRSWLLIIILFILLSECFNISQVDMGKTQ
jgi:hypothetical protein